MMNKVGSIVVVTWSQLWSQGHSLANKVLPHAGQKYNA